MENSMQDKLAAIKAIKDKFVSSITKIYINSLKREVSFREITVSELKKLSRIMIDNENRKDIVYDAQCAVLKSVCLEEDLDIYSLTEFDKIKLLMLLYQRNMILQEITFTCPECNSLNKYAIDFNQSIAKLDAFDLNDINYTYENLNWKFDFVLAYPIVSRVSKFYSSRYLNIKKSKDKKAIEALNNSINIDYINLFIKKIEFTDKSNGLKNTIDVSDYTIDELFEIISVFPQDVLYSEKGIISYITMEFITKINDTFEKHRCTTCGNICDGLSDSDVEGFL